MKKNLKTVQEKGNDPCLIDFYRDHFVLKDSSLEMDHPHLRMELLKTISIEDIYPKLKDFQGFSQVSLSSYDENANHISPDLFSKLLLKTDYLRCSYDN
jgi:hypothetical protein